MEYFDACAMTQKLARREHVQPSIHSRAPGLVGLLAWTDVFAWHDTSRLPLWHLGLKGGIDPGGDVVLGAGGTEPADGLELVLAGLGRAGLDRLLVDDSVNLLAHLAGPGLALDLVAVDHATAVGKGA